MIIPQRVVALELFGVHLWGKKNKISDTIGDSKYYTVKVINASSSYEEDLKIVRLSSWLIVQKDQPASGSAGLLSRARGDYRRILEALYAVGRYGSVISIKINDREAADISADSEFPDHVEIVISIYCGPQYRFDRVTIRTLTPQLNNHKPALISLMNDITGAVAKSSTIFQIETLVIDGWREQGYAKAQIASRGVIADHSTRTVTVDIRVHPGSLAYFGNLTIRNISDQTQMDSSYVAWMTGLKTGQKYDPNILVKATHRLSRLEIFRAAVINEADSIQPDGSLPLSLVLQEQTTHRTGAGMACSTLDGCGFEGSWLHRNLYSHAESLHFNTKISNIGSHCNSSYKLKNYSYLLGASFIRPGIFTPDTDYIATIEGQVLERSIFANIYFHSGLTHLFSDSLAGHLYLDAMHIKTKDDYFGKRAFSTIGFLGGLLYDSRDSKTDPHYGFYSEVVTEPFYEEKYGNFINKIIIEERAYLTFGRQNQLVAAIRAKVGAMMGAQAAQLPSNILFFAGGGGSVRGYTYRNIGVRTSSGHVIGGRSLVEVSAEIRMMMTQKIGVVGFMDAGVIGDDLYPHFRESAKTGIGMGIRYKTGIGLIRLDMAMPLNRAKDDPNFGFYIGIGQAF
ncbi:MAG: translocation and assembly module TamA [Candidatus Tokpelaia sp. JSC085]|nr:MAG: translocation and assembly module TamA [Candidatus Tokpelaia sp. JSC085]